MTLTFVNSSINNLHYPGKNLSHTRKGCQRISEMKARTIKLIQNLHANV